MWLDSSDLAVTLSKQSGHLDLNYYNLLQIGIM